MRRPQRRLYLIVPTLMLGVALALRFFVPSATDMLQLQVFDAYQRLKPRPYTAVPVKIIDIDDETLRRLGQWPWPRTRLAELVQRVFDAGAMVICLDVILAEPDRTSPANLLPVWLSTPALAPLRAKLSQLPDYDAILADTLRRTKTVTGFVLTQGPGGRQPAQKWTLRTAGDDPRPFLPAFTDAIVNLPQYEDVAVGNGSFNIVPDHDNIARRIHLMFRLGETIYPGLAAETLRVAENASDYLIKSSGAEHEPGFGAHTGLNMIKIGALGVPTDAHGRIWLHYTRSEPSRYLPAWRLIENDFQRSDIEGHIILLGTSALGLRDVHATPLNPITPGVEVHANVIEQILLGDYLARPDWAEGAELIYLLILGITLIVLLPKLGALSCAGVGATAVIFVVGASWYAYSEWRWLLDPVGPSLEVLLIYLAGSLINFVQTEAERRQVRNAFSHYLAPTVVDQLVADPSRLVLGGEKRVVTCLFTDVAGFTSLTEQTDPQLLVQILNEYLDHACSIVLKHGGTIDKIVGDALHVMFNAPVDQPDHAQRAISCALELDTFCRSVQAQWADRGVRLGDTRIGVNTGMVVVGNFGGKTRFDYTAHGDTINTAARLEGANKYLGTRICVSGATAKHCRGIYFRPIGRLVLKGKTDGVEVFEPMPEAQAERPQNVGYMGAYRLLRSADTAAASAFDNLAHDYPDDGLIAFHASRLVAGKPRRAGEFGDLIVMREK